MGLGGSAAARQQRLCANKFPERPLHLPVPYPAGTRSTVLVNGVIVVENAVHTGALAGKVLRRDATGKVA